MAYSTARRCAGREGTVRRHCFLMGMTIPGCSKSAEWNPETSPSQQSRASPTARWRLTQNSRRTIEAKGPMAYGMRHEIDDAGPTWQPSFHGRGTFAIEDATTLMPPTEDECEEGHSGARNDPTQPRASTNRSNRGGREHASDQRLVVTGGTMPPPDD